MKKVKVLRTYTNNFLFLLEIDLNQVSKVRNGIWLSFSFWKQSRRMVCWWDEETKEICFSEKTEKEIVFMTKQQNDISLKLRSVDYVSEGL